MNSSSIETIVTNPFVFAHLMNLQQQLKRSFDKNSAQYTEEIIKAIQEAPSVTLWVKDILIPNIYQGDDGLDEILTDIETENDILVSATKMQIVLNILDSLPASLEKVMDDMDKSDIQDSIKRFETNIPFKVYH